MARGRESGRWKTSGRKRKSLVGVSAPRQPTLPRLLYPRLLYSRPAALLHANAALPHPVGPGAVLGVTNALLSLLHRREERRKQEERWCEGKSPGACRPVSSRDLLSGLGQVLASLTVTCQIQGHALPRSPSSCSGACLLSSLLGADWGWQVAWVVWSSVKGADLEEASGALQDWETVTRGSKRDRHGH